MTKAFQSVLEKLRDLREPFHPSMQAFPALEVDQLTRELALIAKAEAAGKRERPASDETGPDSTELDILADIERRARKGAEDYRSQLTLYEGRIRRALISADQRVMIEAAGQNALADYVALTTDDLNHLHNDREELEGRARELRDFQEANGLRRPPHVIQRREQVLRLLVLAIFVIVESILNGMFFAKGSEGGLIGGVSQALVLSLLNIGGAVLYAVLGMPLLRHSRIGGRFVGILATLAYIVWVLLLNLAIAHYRDLFVLHEGQVAMDVLAGRLWTAPLHLMEAQSWLLGILGVALSIVSLIDAAGLNDPYPGYGALGRRHKEAVCDFAEHNSRCLQGLQGLRDSAVADMTAVIEAMRTSEYDLRLATEGRERLHQNYVAYLDHLAVAYQQLVRRYREANQAVRTTADPGYFQSWPAPPAFLGTSPLPPLPELATDARTTVIEQMEYYIGKVNAAFEDALSRYKSVAQVARGGADSAVA